MCRRSVLGREPRSTEFLGSPNLVRADADKMLRTFLAVHVFRAPNSTAVPATGRLTDFVALDHLLACSIALGCL